MSLTRDLGERGPHVTAKASNNKVINKEQNYRTYTESDSSAKIETVGSSDISERTVVGGVCDCERALRPNCETVTESEPGDRFLPGSLRKGKTSETFFMKFWF